MDKFKISIQNFPALGGSRIKIKFWRGKFYVLSFSFAFCILSFALVCFAQQSDDLEFTLDVSQETIPLPKIFRPNIDLSGRGYHSVATWPQTLAAKEALDTWLKDIGFRGMYRMQYDLWEINQVSKDRDAQNALLGNYEDVIKKITDAGGIVILDIFGTPAGLGKVLDKKSPPWDLKAFKELVKGAIRELSCNKRYNIWYEVWNAPDLDGFFLGRKQEYLHLYRVVAEAIKELEAETKIHIPLGGPSVSWWFQNLEGNTIVTPEESLIYGLIRFCYSYRLPLNFITWHGYSTDPGAELENTVYKKKMAVNLIRDWLTYFKFERNTPLIVDEWNYDRDTNVLPERKTSSFICASFIPNRIKNMYKADLDYQLYFCLEDFQNNKEGVVRNVGIFYFDSESLEYKGGPKSIYNVFRMMSNLGKDMFLSKFNDEFVGVIATKSDEGLVLLINNYMDPEIFNSYLSKNIASLNKAERKILLNFIKSGQLKKIMHHQTEVSNLRASKRVKALLNKARELNETAERFSASPRKLKIVIKNLKGNFLYQRFSVDSSCGLSCEFSPLEQKEIDADGSYQELMTLSPYSVHLIVLTKKPKEPELIETQGNIQPAPTVIPQETNVTGAALNLGNSTDKE